MRVVDPFIAELKQEYQTTRRLLASLPPERFEWAPHPRAMPLGQLARHVAELPGLVVEIVSGNTFDFADRQAPAPTPQTVPSLIALADESVARAEAYLGSLDDARATAAWTLVNADRELLSIPRIGAVRAFLLNHLYHHRGQLSLCLRILDLPVPSVYGPTADENPFG